MIAAGWALWKAVGIGSSQAFDFLADGFNAWSQSAQYDQAEGREFLMEMLSGLSDNPPVPWQTLEAAPREAVEPLAAHYTARCWAATKLRGEISDPAELQTWEPTIFEAISQSRQEFVPAAAADLARRYAAANGLPEPWLPNSAEVRQAASDYETHDQSAAPDPPLIATQAVDEEADAFPRIVAVRQTGDAAIDRAHALLAALMPFGSAQTVGRPFGEGAGLEEAIQVVHEHCGRDLDTIRETGRMICYALLAADIGSPFSGADLDEVMGATRAARETSGISQHVFTAVFELANAAKLFMDEIKAESGPIYDLWSHRGPEVPAEFLAWHAVAYHRLGAAGKIDLFDGEVIRRGSSTSGVSKESDPSATKTEPVSPSGGLLERVYPAFRSELADFLAGETVLNVAYGHCNAGISSKDFEDSGFYVVTATRVIFMYVKGGVLTKERPVFQELPVDRIEKVGMQRTGEDLSITWSDSFGHPKLWRGYVWGEGSKQAVETQLLVDSIREAIVMSQSTADASRDLAMERLRQERGF